MSDNQRHKTLNICGLKLHLHLSKVQDERMAERYGPYGIDAHPQACWQIICVDDYAGDITQDRAPEASLHDEHFEMCNHRGFAVTLDVQSRQGILHHDSDAGSVFENTLIPPMGVHGALRALVPTLLAYEGKGLGIHGVGLAFEEEAAVFMGPSGIGKSTLGGMFPLDRVLCDELVVLAPQNAPTPEPETSFQLMATPYPGSLEFHPKPRSLPTKRAFVLKQGIHNEILPLATKDALKNLMTCITLPEGTGPWHDFAFELAHDLACGLEWYTLSFNRDADAVRRMLDRFFVVQSGAGEGSGRDDA